MLFLLNQLSLAANVRLTAEYAEGQYLSLNEMIGSRLHL